MSYRDFTVELPDGEMGPRVEAALAGPVAAAVLASIREIASEHVDTGNFVAHLTPQDTLQYPYLGNPHVLAVVSPDEYGDYLERGHAGFHLAAHWGARGGRWLISKQGTLYARVPFRSRTPGDISGGLSTGRKRSMMPSEVYRKALGLPHRGRLTGFGDLYKQSKSYNYYRRAGQTMPERLKGEQGYTWRSSAYEGLFRATAVTPAGGRHTSYMTIRTITPDSPGWWIPPQPPLRIFERGLERAAPVVQAMLNEAAVADIEEALEAVTGDL